LLQNGAKWTIIALALGEGLEGALRARFCFQGGKISILHYFWCKL
jgi:hypothetical protein